MIISSDVCYDIGVGVIRLSSVACLGKYLPWPALERLLLCNKIWGSDS